MAKFTNLQPAENYDIVDCDAMFLTQGISGCDAMVSAADWPAGARAYLTGGAGSEGDPDFDLDSPDDFCHGAPDDIAK